MKEGEEPGVELAGIGAVLQKDGDVFHILRVAPGSGAAEVGLAAGDALLFINGLSVKPMTFDDALPLLRGPEGTTVTVVVAKAGTARTTTLTVPRRLVRG